jgi:hypothetical protein
LADCAGIEKGNIPVLVNDKILWRALNMIFALSDCRAGVHAVGICQLKFIDKILRVGGRIEISDAHDDDVLILLVNSLEFRRFIAAWGAPTSPKIYYDNFAPIIFEPKLIAIECCKCEIRGGSTGGAHLTLSGDQLQADHCNHR